MEKEKQVFLQWFNLPKCVVAALLMVEGLFSLLLYCESGINQYAGKKTLTDVFRVSLLLLEFSCFRNIVLPYHLRMFLLVFMRRLHLLTEIISFVFCSVQYMKKNTLLNIK